MGDFLGAVFYYLLLGPVVATASGLVGGVVGKGEEGWIKR
jgi:hypothetical protein